MGLHLHSLPSLLRQDNTRISSAGCLGELCAFLTEEELNTVLQQYLLGRPLVSTGGFLFRASLSPLPLRGSSDSGTTLSLEIQLLKQNGVSGGSAAPSVSAPRTQATVWSSL